MSKLTQTIICVAGILIIITCLSILFRRPANPSIDMIREWEAAKQEAVDNATKPLENKIKELEEKNVRRLDGAGSVSSSELGID